MRPLPIRLLKEKHKNIGGAAILKKEKKTKTKTVLKYAFNFV